MHPTALLQELMSRPDFDPTTLVGDTAQEWLRHIVRRMFPGSTSQLQSQQVAAQSSQKVKGKKNDTSGLDYRSETTDPAASPSKVTHVSQPPSFNRPLPSLTTCNRHAALAYAVVGPRVRGKFDAKRAESLGLKAGPLRARVARGETVTVVGSDGLERSVGPGDVVGASEDPGVCYFLRYSHVSVNLEMMKL